MPNFGPVHKLIVHEVGGSYGPYSTVDFEDYEIEHPAECRKVKHTMAGIDGSTSEEWEEYECGVGYQVAMAGARFCLQYVGTPINEPGEYLIRAWAETYRGFEYTEYDGGIALEPTPGVAMGTR